MEAHQIPHWDQMDNPRDEKVIQKIKHKKLSTRTSDPREGTNKCRLCGRCKESITHLPKCRKLKPIMDFVRKLWEAMGKTSDEHKSLTWLFGITANDEALTESERAILIVFWRVVYRRMTLLSLKKRKFNKASVIQELAFEIMKRILAFQIERRRFYFRRKHVHKSTEQPKYYLPEKFAEQVAQMGKLDLRTGRLTVKPEIKKLLYEQKVWRKLDEDG